MIDPSYHLYKSINKYVIFNKWIDESKCEDEFLECKSPASNKLNQECKINLAKAISGFSNTIGGVLVYGLSTNKQNHSGLDIINHIEPIGNIQKLYITIRNEIPLLTTPSITDFNAKIIRKKKNDKEGILVIHIPKYLSDPVMSIGDKHFYFRTGDEFLKAPYEMIKRLFSASEVPDLNIYVNIDAAEKKQDNSWVIPICIKNLSSAIAEYAIVQIKLESHKQCKKFTINKFRDLSNINQGKKVWGTSLQPEVIHKRLPIRLGEIELKLKPHKKKCTFKTYIYANKMIARTKVFDIIFQKDKINIKISNSKYLY